METRDNSPICRLCLTSDGHFVYIFKQNVGQINITEVIRNFLRIDVCEGDGYPPFVCAQCYNKLQDIKQFRDQCVQSKHAYDSLKTEQKNNFQITNAEDHLLEPSAEIKKESDDSLENEYDVAEQIPLDIVKTELTEEDGVFTIGSTEGCSLPHPSSNYQDDNQQQALLTCGRSIQWHSNNNNIIEEEEDESAIRTYHSNGNGNSAQYEMAIRLWKDRVRQARRRAMESVEEREKRLAQDRERTRLRRAKESPEEKAKRLERARKYMAEKRRRLIQLVAMENDGGHGN